MKILVISLAGIGDTLIATPLLHELRANFPDATIDAFVLWAGSKDLLEGNPHLNAIHQKNLIKEGASRSLLFLFGLRKEKYDISINTHPQSRIHYRVISKIVNARIRLSHDYDNVTVLDRWLVNRTLPQDYTIHGLENNVRLLKLLDKEPVLARHEFELFLSPAEEQWAEKFIGDHKLSRRKRLGVHIGSGGTKNLALKRWPLAHYLALFRQLEQSHPHVAILLFGGPEEEPAHAQILQATGGKQVFLTQTQNLRQAAALLKRMDAFLSVDTALMHLAAAMKVPNQVVIEAPTLNATNVPYGNPFRLVKNPVVNGRNLDYYRYDGRPIQGTTEELIQCMASIKVEDVQRVLRELLSQETTSRC